MWTCAFFACRNHLRHSTEVKVSGNLLVGWVLILWQCTHHTHHRSASGQHGHASWLFKNMVAQLHMNSLFSIYCQSSATTNIENSNNVHWQLGNLSVTCFFPLIHGHTLSHASELKCTFEGHLHGMRSACDEMRVTTLFRWGNRLALTEPDHTHRRKMAMAHETDSWILLQLDQHSSCCLVDPQTGHGGSVPVGKPWATMVANMLTLFVQN